MEFLSTNQNDLLSNVGIASRMSAALKVGEGYGKQNRTCSIVSNIDCENWRLLERREA